MVTIYSFLKLVCLLSPKPGCMPSNELKDLKKKTEGSLRKKKLHVRITTSPATCPSDLTLVSPHNRVSHFLEINLISTCSSAEWHVRGLQALLLPATGQEITHAVHTGENLPRNRIAGTQHETGLSILLDTVLPN